MKSLESPRYQPGQFLTAGQLQAEQGYQDALRQIHDGALHTWGLAQGLQVEWETAGVRVRVLPGAAVTPGGDLLRLEEAVLLPVPSPLPTGGLALILQRPAPAPRLDLLQATPGRLRQPAPAGDGGPSAWSTEDAEVGWTNWADWLAQQALVLTRLDGAGLHPEVRRPVGIQVGTLRFASLALAPEREAALSGWRTSPQTQGLRLSADEVRIAPRTPVKGGAPNEAVVTLAQGRLGVGTMTPRATLDVLAPNAPRTGPGTLTSRGTQVWGTDAQLGALLAVGDQVAMRTATGEGRATVVELNPDGAPRPGEPLDVDRDPWTFRTDRSLEAEGSAWALMRRQVARFTSPSGEALLRVDRDGKVQVGPGPGPTASSPLLTVTGGALRLRGPGRAVGFAGSGQLGGGGTGLQVDVPRKRMRLFSAGPLRLLPGVPSGSHSGSAAGATAGAAPATGAPAGTAAGVAAPAPWGLRLDGQGRVAVGSQDPVADPPDPLQVEGRLSSVSLPGRPGGFVFPDGTLQTTAAVSAPIGAVLSWVRPTPQTPVPAAFRVCDGSTVDVRGSPFFGQPTPDLRDRFILGVTDWKRVGETSPAEHTHTHPVPQHTHAFPHTHPGGSGVSGEATDAAGDASSGGVAATDARHTHRVVASVVSGEAPFTQPNSDAGTSGPTGSAAVSPPYVGLLWLIRIV